MTIQVQNTLVVTEIGVLKWVVKNFILQVDIISGFASDYDMIFRVCQYRRVTLKFEFS